MKDASYHLIHCSVGWRAPQGQIHWGGSKPIIISLLEKMNLHISLGVYGKHTRFDTFLEELMYRCPGHGVLLQTKQFYKVLAEHPHSMCKAGRHWENEWDATNIWGECESPPRYRREIGIKSQYFEFGNNNTTVLISPWT